jgi:hypothetical protein
MRLTGEFILESAHGVPQAARWDCPELNAQGESVFIGHLIPVSIPV